MAQPLSTKYSINAPFTVGSFEKHKSRDTLRGGKFDSHDRRHNTRSDNSQYRDQNVGNRDKHQSGRHSKHKSSRTDCCQFNDKSVKNTNKKLTNDNGIGMVMSQQHGHANGGKKHGYDSGNHPRQPRNSHPNRTANGTTYHGNGNTARDSHASQHAKNKPRKKNVASVSRFRFPKAGSPEDVASRKACDKLMAKQFAQDMEDEARHAALAAARGWDRETGFKFPILDVDFILHNLSSILNESEIPRCILFEMIVPRPGIMLVSPRSMDASHPRPSAREHAALIAPIICKLKIAIDKGTVPLKGVQHCVSIDELRGVLVLFSSEDSLALNTAIVQHASMTFEDVQWRIHRISYLQYERNLRNLGKNTSKEAQSNRNRSQRNDSSNDRKESNERDVAPRAREPTLEEMTIVIRALGHKFGPRHVHAWIKAHKQDIIIGRVTVRQTMMVGVVVFKKPNRAKGLVNPANTSTMFRKKMFFGTTAAKRWDLKHYGSRKERTAAFFAWADVNDSEGKFRFIEGIGWQDGTEQRSGMTGFGHLACDHDRRMAHVNHSFNLLNLNENNGGNNGGFGNQQLNSGHFGGSAHGRGSGPSAQANHGSLGLYANEGQPCDANEKGKSGNGDQDDEEEDDDVEM